MRLALPVAIVAVLLLLARPVAACLWDYDTLAAEASGQMADVVQIIAGRFERNPPLYYEIRLKHSAERIAANPDDLAAYDDAGVACDRLGRSDQAIAWMEKKARRLDVAKPPEGKPHEIDEHRYRYLANVGTFWVHRWIRNGADRSKIDEVKTARDFIAKAIELNPNAHFGRETYQLKALDWIIKPVRHGSDSILPGFLDPVDPANSTDATIRGLSGLVALGNAWESVDAFNTLAQALHRDGQRNSVALLAVYRAFELIDAGRRSLDPYAPTAPEELKHQIEMGIKVGVYDSNRNMLINDSMGPQDTEAVWAAFRKLRDEADAWHAERLAFMMPRLEAGRHPDTDPTFWQGYVERPAPPIPATPGDPWWMQVARSLGIGGILTFLALAVAAMIVVPILLLCWIRRGRAKPVARTTEV